MSHQRERPRDDIPLWTRSQHSTSVLPHRPAIYTRNKRENPMYYGESSKGRRSEKARIRKRLSHQRQRMRFNIDTTPIVTRRLRTSSLKAIRKEKDKNRKSACPWVYDENWRYVPTEHRAASFLGLPTELRQQILYESLSVNIEMLHNKKILTRRIGELCCVCPLVRMNMSYVSARWKRDLQALILEEEKNSISLQELGWPASAVDSILPAPTSAKAARRKQSKELRQKIQRRRPHKCWYCDERHFGIKNYCPMSREDPERWNQLTKPTNREREARQVGFGPLGGTLIRFADEDEDEKDTVHKAEGERKRT